MLADPPAPAAGRRHAKKWRRSENDPSRDRAIIIRLRPEGIVRPNRTAWLGSEMREPFPGARNVVHRKTGKKTTRMALGWAVMTGRKARRKMLNEQST